MIRPILTISGFIFSILTTYSQTGIWSGALEVQGNKIPIVFHFNPEGSTMDSPAQNAKGIPVELSYATDSVVNVSIPMIRAKFNGKYSDDKIEGTFTQSGLTLPLVLTSGENKPKRPQTPTVKGPYTEEEVSFSNGDAILKGTLTLPDGYDRDTPVVLMVTGSGLQNRDEEILDHKPFAVIADNLAKAGIASLRYDDRGFGESTGDAVSCTTQDLMMDALSGVELLRKRFNKVGVLGHSEGGTIAMMLAAAKKSDFIISLAGMVISGKETLLAQNRHLLAATGLPEETVDEYCSLLSMIFEDDNNFSEKLSASAIPSELKKNLEAVALQAGTPYMRYFLRMDMRDRLSDISCPVLALNGTKDTQVFSNDNLAPLQKELKLRNSNKIMAIEGLNHLFQHCVTGSPMEYGNIEETISPEILEIINQWIKNIYNSSYGL